jgi:hypothetical protein
LAFAARKFDRRTKFSKFSIQYGYAEFIFRWSRFIVVAELLWIVAELLFIGGWVLLSLVEFIHWEIETSLWSRVRVIGVDLCSGGPSRNSLDSSIDIWGASLALVEIKPWRRRLHMLMSHCCCY